MRVTGVRNTENIASLLFRQDGNVKIRGFPPVIHERWLDLPRKTELRNLAASDVSEEAAKPRRSTKSNYGIHAKSDSSIYRIKHKWQYSLPDWGPEIKSKLITTSKIY